MTPAGNGNYTYPVNNLQHGDTIEYSFTYNPGLGAVDSPTLTYIHGVAMLVSSVEDQLPCVMRDLLDDKAHLLERHQA